MINYEYWPYARRVHIRRDLRVVVPVTEEPISLEMARLHLRIQADGSPSVHEDDTIIQQVFIPAAREACEQYLGAALAPQTIELVLDAFPDSHGVCQPSREIELPFGPVHSVESLSYLADGISTLFVDYNFARYGDRVRLTQAGSWPPVDDSPDAVTVHYVTGYTLPGASPDFAPLPAALRAAMLLTLSQIYDNCIEGTVCDIKDLPVGVHYLLDPYKRKVGFV